MKYQGDAFDSGGISAFATFGESLLEKRLGIGEQGDALARGALAAKIVGEALAIRGLCKHARKSELADTPRAGEKQGVRDTIAAKSAAERSDDALVA